MKRLLLGALLIMSTFLIGTLISCDVTTSDAAQQSQTGAKQTDLSKYQVPRDAQGNTIEQENIIGKNQVTTDPTKILWMHIMTADGKLVARIPVRGKITSSGKRLEPVSAHARSGEYQDRLPQTTGGYYTTELIQPDGTYGESDKYVYWFDPLGRYHQLGSCGMGSYLLTDYPIDLENPQDKVTGLYNAEKSKIDFEQAKINLQKSQTN